VNHPAKITDGHLNVAIGRACQAVALWCYRKPAHQVSV
jgi:hypothetical protein